MCVISAFAGKAIVSTIEYVRMEGDASSDLQCPALGGCLDDGDGSVRV